MWLKIKRLTTPIFVKLTILYTVILSGILLFTSLLTAAGLYYVLYAQADDDIRLSSSSITSYFAAGNPIDVSVLENNLLVPGVILRVFDNQNHLLVDSAPYTPGNRGLSKEDLEDVNPLNYTPFNKRPLRIIRLDHYFYYYIERSVEQDGQVYQLRFMKTLTEQTHFLKTLIKSLLVTNVLGLLIAIVSGMYISRKTLRPIRDITDTVKEIEVNNLDTRINETGSEDELQELAKTFNHMLNRIQSGFEQQRRFVSDASHELRTPITVISGYADMLDRWGKQDPSVLEEGISAIKSEASNMYGLIEKLLFLARADQNRQVVNKKEVETEPIITEIFQESRMIAPNHCIALDQNDPAIIYADAHSIKELLRIFIENSIKYTPEGGSIRLASRRVDNNLEITIQDSGIGIPEEEQPKIFDRFYRVEKSRAKVTGGTGLGLSIAQWIAQQHNSTLELTSKPGEGTTIKVRIPIMAAQ